MATRATPSRPPPGHGARECFDIYVLFAHYNSLYFKDSLGACTVDWFPNPLPSEVSTCQYNGGACDIVLSKSLMECQTSDDLKNALLHEMIHAYLCMKEQNENHSDHGPSFQTMMKSINSSSVADRHRPADGYNITINHELKRKLNQYECWKCEDLVKTARIGGPSYHDCIENKGPDGFCSNPSCHFHRHKRVCSGTYCRVQGSPTGRGGTNVKAKFSNCPEAKTEGSTVSRWASEKPAAAGNPDERDARMRASAGSRKPFGEALGSSSHSFGVDSPKQAAYNEIQGRAQNGKAALEIPKRARTSTPKNIHDAALNKRRRLLSRDDNGSSVIIEWLDLVAVEDTEEVEEPLINKRTERRRAEKLGGVDVEEPLINERTERRQAEKLNSVEVDAEAAPSSHLNDARTAGDVLPRNGQPSSAVEGPTSGGVREDDHSSNLRIQVEVVEISE